MKAHIPDFRSVSHLCDVIDPQKAKGVVKHCVQFLTNSGIEFTTIACRGLSGLLLAPLVAAEMGKTLLVVRKVARTGHGSRPVEGDYNAKGYIILDDFIDSGKTVREIMDAVEEEVGRDARCLGVLQFHYFEHPKSSVWFSEGSQVFNTRVVMMHQRRLDEEHARKEEEYRLQRERTEKTIAELRCGRAVSVRGGAEQEPVSPSTFVKTLEDVWLTNFPAFSEVAHGMHKLTNEEVRKVRALYKTGAYLQREIAQMFRVSRENVSAITREKSWSHL